MIEGIVLAIVGAVFSVAGFFFVHWLNSIDNQLETISKITAILKKRVGTLEDNLVSERIFNETIDSLRKAIDENKVGLTSLRQQLVHIKDHRFDSEMETSSLPRKGHYDGHHSSN